MTQKKKKIKRVRPLFIRIFFGIAVPFLILFGIFIGIVVKNDFKFRRLHEQIAAESETRHIVEQLPAILPQESLLTNPEALGKIVRGFIAGTSTESLDFIDPATGKSLLESGHPSSLIPEKGWQLSTSHTRQIQKTLTQVREGTGSYHLHLDDPSRKIYAYIPFRPPLKKEFLIVVAQFPLTTLSDAFIQALRILSLMTFLTVLLALAIAFLLTIHIVRPLLAINRACREILEGNLGKKVFVKSGDEIELMASNFNRMSQAMLVMTHAAGDANPLTQLPGNRIIREEVNRRLSENLKFVFFHVDIDHFKAFNDEYGLSKGDDVLRYTAGLLSETAKAFEGHHFVGHQGGDDYILVLEVSQAEKIAKSICQKFDDSLKTFYSAEDLARGYFLGKDSRSGSSFDENELKRQPLMSISLAGVTNLKRPYNSFEDILEHSISVKKRAKKLPYSVYLIEE